MPLALALAIRTIVQLGTTLAVYTTAEAFIKAGQPLLIKFLQGVFGFTEQEALDFLHDYMIDQAFAFGLTAVALRKQMPTIVAEKLGFTSKGFNKLGFSTQVKKKIENTIKKAPPDILTTGWGAWSPVMKLMSVITGVFMLTQSIEVFAYRPQFFTNILGFFGLGKISRKILIPPPKPLFSDTEISQFASSMKIEEDTLRGYLEAATEVVRSQAKVPTKANLLKVIREDLLPVAGGIDPSTGKPVSPTTTAFKTFLGTITQQALAAAVPFTERQDDLIESMAELQDAARNNEAPFMASLLGRIIREIKVVSSVTTKDGFVQRGVTQQIVSGHRTDGTPKFKLVTNKFAVADIYLVSEKGARTKISRIVYGPVDSVRFQPKQNDLLAMQTALSAKVETGTTLGSFFKEQGQTLPPVSARAPLYEELELGKATYYTGTGEQNAKMSLKLLEVAQSGAVLPSGRTLAEALKGQILVPSTQSDEQALEPFREEIRIRTNSVRLDQRQFDFQLPDGRTIRANINPGSAATIILAGGGVIPKG